MNPVRAFRDPPAANGRQWIAYPRSSDCYRRRAEVFRLAYLLLGGRAAADRFLNCPDPGLAATPLAVAMESRFGCFKVSLLIRRCAIGLSPTHG